MSRPLVVFTVYFGELPPWLPLTMRSMELNANVSFVIVGDAPPPAVVPPNVAFETIAWPTMQQRLSLLLTPENMSSVSYAGLYDARRAVEGGGGGKANDIKPLVATLFPEHVAGHEWWAWSDLDVIFGDILHFFGRAAQRPACCRVPLRPNGEPKSTRAVNVYLHRAACPCPADAKVNVVCPLYPNPWRKKAWGAFTAFRTGQFQPYADSGGGGSSSDGVSAEAAAASAEELVEGRTLYMHSPAWRGVVGAPEYGHNSPRSPHLATHRAALHRIGCVRYDEYRGHRPHHSRHRRRHCPMALDG